MNYLFCSRKKTVAFLLAGMVVLLLAFSACAGPAGPVGPAGPPGPPGEASAESLACLVVSPNSAELGMALVMTPLIFRGAGWPAEETVMIDLIGAGLEGEDAHLASATVNEYGAFSASVGAGEKIWEILHGSITEMGLKMSFDNPPAAPGVYTAKATGFTSGIVATCPFELKAPPAK